MATKKIKINFKMPTPTAAERLHAQQQKNRKAAGLPDPSEYKKKLDAMKSEEVELLDEMPESNMKVRDVHSHLKKAGWALARSKGGHDVYKHPKAKHSIPVPRHNQLKAPLIRGIMKASKVEEQLEKKGRFVSGPVKQPFKSSTIVTSVKEGFRIGGMATGGRGNIHMYDRNPGPKDGSELENVPFHAKTEKQKKLQNALNDLGKKMKETHPKLKEAKDPQEYDYEGDMAKSDLRSILHHAKELHDMIEDNTNLAEWCQSKITLAEDYLSTVANYMRSEMNEGFGPNPSPNKTIVTVNGHNAATHNPDGTKKEIRGRDVNGKPIYHSNSGLSFRKFATKADGTQGVELHVGTNVPKSQPHPNSPNGAYARKYNEETVQEDKNDYQRKIEKNNKNFIAASKRQKNPLTNVHTAQTKQKPVKEDVKLNEQGRDLHGLHTVRDLHLSKDDYLRKYTPKKSQDDAKKKQPQGAEFAAQRRKERLASSGRMDENVQLDEKKNLPGLWANIHAKRKRGEPPAKPGDKDYPKTLNIESTEEPTEGEMKGKQQGVSRKAQIVRDAAKGKKSDNPDKFQKDPELSSEIHKT
jgi:predicted RNA binding protein YcfA (HicA-like mRNA interferase family)